MEGVRQLMDMVRAELKMTERPDEAIQGRDPQHLGSVTKAQNHG